MIVLTFIFTHENNEILKTYTNPLKEAIRQSLPTKLNPTKSYQQPLPLSSLKYVPRRAHPRKLKYSQLKIKEIPHWISCPDAETENGIWSVAVTLNEVDYALVLAASIKVQNIQQPC